MAELLFPEYKDAFHSFYLSYTTDRKQFLIQYNLDPKQYEENISPIELLQVFGDHIHRLGYLDWRGEENAHEIQEFIATQIPSKIKWTYTQRLRDSTSATQQQDPEFTTKYLIALDQDLLTIDYRLLIFNTDSDTHVFLPTTHRIFSLAMSHAPHLFQ